MRVADIGAGTGYFTIPVARAIGASGRVFAVDLQSEMLDLMREKLEEPNAPGNIATHVLHRHP
jgi:ubiquinone/menaquinone biosynthesis C-methylase UbiE